MAILRFEPIYQPRVWGGRALGESLGRNLPGEGPIGEAWEIVDRPEAQSVHRDSRKTLRELLLSDSAAIMGPGYDPVKPFPILVKWLDCSQRLSLQVHPPAEIAARLGGEPKTECWYLAETHDEAALIVGLRRGVKRAEFEHAITTETLEPLLHRFPVQPGQAILLESGRLHAIDAGNLILEIQQNSDTTFRVYDWGRQGLDGKPRQLHVQQSLQSIDFTDSKPQALPAFTAPGERTIANCREFRIRQINLLPGQALRFNANQQARILSLVRGRLVEPGTGQAIQKAENVLLPYHADVAVRAEMDSTVLITDQFVE